jgi:polar amino acid transport system permease protein
MIISARVTIELTIVSVLLGGSAGFLIGALLAKRAGTRVLSLCVDLVRSIPPLVLILFFYYFLSKQVIGVSFDRFWVYTIAMSLNMSAFTADIIRAAINNVPPEAVDAARSLGFSEYQIIRHISSAYIVRDATPGMSLLVIAMLKTSSLAAIVNIPEIVYTAETVLSATSRSLEVWVVVGILYTVLVLPATYLARRVESWARCGQRIVVS